MYKTFLVARREFLATVLTKGFLIGLILPPVIGVVGFVLVPLLMNSAAPKSAGLIGIVDQSGEVAPALEKSLSPEAFKERASRKLEKAQQKLRDRGLNLPADDRSTATASAMLAASAPMLKPELLPPSQNVDEAKEPLKSARVRDSDDAARAQRVALIVIPPGVVTLPAPEGDAPAEYKHYQLYAAPKLDIEVRSEITEQVDKAIVDARLRIAKLDPAQVRALSADPVTDSMVITAEGDRKDNGVAAMLIPGGFLVLLWVSVLVGGQGLLMSTIEEKSSRVMEVILSAVSPMELMVGKIVGQMAVASLILGLYAFTGVGALVVFSMSHLIEPMTLVYAAIYFVIAFFLMASMMAAIGSVVNDIREAQVLMQPIMLVMVIPMMLWLPISRNPNGLAALIFSFLPPASPFVMVIRLAGSEKIPAWQIPASMAIGVASMIFMAWATAKIFRIGILMYGKPPNLKTLIKWVRMA